MEKEYHKLTIKPINPDINVIEDPQGDCHRLTSATNTLTVSHREQPTQETINFILGTYKKGIGISNIELTSTVGLVDTYTITYTDGTTTTFDVTNGSNGTNGRGIVSILKTSTQELTDTYTITYTDGTTSTFEVTNGVDGVSVESITLYETVGLVDTYEIIYSTGTRSYFDVTNGSPGDDGREVEIQNSGTYIQWRYVGEINWTNIVALADLKGDTGANIELQKSATHIQWCVVGSSTWIDLVALSDLKGDAGRGIVSIIKTSTVGLVDTYTVTYSDTTTSTFDVTNGEKGDTGTSAYEIYVAGGGTLSEVDFNASITDIPSHISDATKHIDNTTDEFSGTIDETNDKFTIWDNSLLKWIRFSFTSMKTWLSSLYLKLDQTTQQTINGILQNQSTAALESAPLGAELLTPSGWGTTNWTGDFVAGFTHTTGNVTPLTNTLAALNATLYQITYTITNRTAGSINITFGGMSTGAVTASGAIGNKTASTGTLSIAPTSDFNGTIVISIKRITGIYAPTYQILDSTGISNIEIRSSLNTLNNTFIGKGAGRNNTTGYSNSAQGVYALFNNTTGSNNSAQGGYALQNNTTGSNNSAQGGYALQNNTTGYSNSAQGYAALRNNTTGSNNSAQGGYALQNNTTGSNNSAQGGYALYSNTTGYNNSAQGGYALQNNTTGYQNSAQGVYALYSNTTGYNNSAQGVNAGRYLADGVTANQTSNNSIFLGANTKSKQAGQTNEIVIGNNAIGNGSNTVTLGHTDITNTYLRGLVHLNDGVQIGDNTAVASEALKGVVRYRENAGGSFYEMCMKKSDGSYEWTAIVSHQ